MLALERFDESQPEESNRGFGSLKSEFGNLPLRQLGYHSRVVGLAMRTCITQTFYNPFDEVIEATYIFPIDGEQAVVDCEMRVGQRTIRACLKERGEARRDYARAMRYGYRAALLEENRAETFSMKVGNIPPGEAIQVRIETVGVLPVVDGEWTLRLPLVVAPRYTSGLALPQSPAGSGTTQDTEQVPDASTVTPPTWLPGFANPVQLRLDVDIQMDQLMESTLAKQLRSSLHAVLVERDEFQPASRCRVSVQPGERVDRDFVLRGRIDASQVKTSLALESDSRDRSTMTFALHIVPPRAESHEGRNIVFLLDRSSSMMGWKMAAARRGMSRLVDSLAARDRFQVLAFDNQVEFFPLDAKKNGVSQRGWLESGDVQRYEAVRWLARIEPRGGTEMGLAIEHGLRAFAARGENQPQRQNAIVLVTDGQVTGEDSLLRLLGTIPQEHRPKLFCLGIDRAVNGSVLQRLAKCSGGTYELVESEKRLDEVLRRFSQEMGSPAISRLRIKSRAENAVSLAPTNAETLFSARSVSIYGRTSFHESLTLNLTGTLANGEPWQQEVTSSAVRAGDPPVLQPLWGKARVREMEDELALCGHRDPQLTQQIIECSLACNVLSRLTAFVAVDESEQVSSGEALHAIVQPSAYPEGWAMPLTPLDHSTLIRATRPAPPPVPQRFSKETASKIPEQLAKRRLVSKEQLTEARRVARETGKELVDVLMQLQFVSVEDIARSVAAVARCQYIDLETIQVPAHVIQIVPESVARENQILPRAEEEDTITIVTSDPNDIDTIEKLQFILNKRIKVEVATASAIQEAINKYYCYEQGDEILYGEMDAGESADSIMQEFTDTQIDFTTTESGVARTLDGSLPEPEPTDIPIVKLTNLIITEAVQLRASHAMLTPKPDCFTVAYVVNGKLKDRDNIPKRLQNAIVSRLMSLTQLDVADRKGLQSGTIHVTVGIEEYELQIHFAHKPEGASILICFTNAKRDTELEPVQKWWEENG